MDFKAAIQLMERGRQAAFPALRLGQLIEALESAPDDRWVYFDFGGLSPKGVASYRGYYSDLALGFHSGAAPNVADLLKHLRRAVGETFEGYKGGDFTMTERTPVWVANYGETSGTGIVRVEEQGWRVVLHTALVDD